MSDMEPPPPGSRLFQAHEFRRGAQEWMSRAVKQVAAEVHPLLAQIPTVALADQPQAPEDLNAADATRRSPSVRTIGVRHNWTISVEEVLAFDLDTLLANLYELADSYGDQLTRGLIKFMTDTTDATGQVVEASELGLIEGMIRAMEMMEFSFDQSGNHNVTMLVHPDMARSLSETTPTPEQQARIDAIIDRKRTEWNARRRRDLP